MDFNVNFRTRTTHGFLWKEGKEGGFIFFIGLSTDGQVPVMGGEAMRGIKSRLIINVNCIYIYFCSINIFHDFALYELAIFNGTTLTKRGF